MRNIILGSLAALAIWGLIPGCGNVADTSGGHAGLVNPAPSLGEPDPFAELDGKSTSATFRKFFLDSVNHRSKGRWTGWGDILNEASWFLSGNAYSSPNSWELNSFEPDSEGILTSILFTVPAGRRGLKLGFQGTWDFMPDAELFAEYRIGGGNWVTIAGFTGRNPALPNWNRYTLGLPDAGVADEQRQVRFRFQGGSTNESGSLVAIDSIAVYQTRLPAPVAWDFDDTETFAHTYWAPGRGVKPDFFDVYTRDDNANPDYTFSHSVPYGDVYKAILGGDVGTYYYAKIKARKAGFDDSEFSNETRSAPHDPLGDLPF